MTEETKAIIIVTILVTAIVIGLLCARYQIKKGNEKYN